MKKDNLYRLKCSLYKDDEGHESHLSSMPFYDPYDNHLLTPLAARKGQLFTIEPINDEHRKEYPAYVIGDAVFVATALNSKEIEVIFFEQDDDNLIDWFEKVE